MKVTISGVRVHSCGVISVDLICVIVGFRLVIVFILSVRNKETNTLRIVEELSLYLVKNNHFAMELAACNPQSNFNHLNTQSEIVVIRS